MSLAPPFAEIEYPESDGKPMAETEIHLEWMIYLRDILKFRYRNQRVYVGANMMLYYVEGDPRKSVAPDVFVAKDCDPGLRNIFKTWEERCVPNVVFEVTSNSTRREDEVTKPRIYAKMGVKELFLYDPTGDYLDTSLVGYRFSRGRKTRIRPDESGALECQELGLNLRLQDGELQVHDSQTGDRLLTQAEAAAARAEAAEAEVRRLKAELDRERRKRS